MMDGEERQFSEDDVWASEDEEDVGFKEEPKVEEAPQAKAEEAHSEPEPPAEAKVAASPSPSPTEPALGEEAILEYFRKAPIPYDRLVEAPEEVLPRLAAFVTQQTLVAAAQGLERVLPTLLEAYLREREAKRTFEERFFGRFPHLRSRSAQIEALARQIRQFEPSMPEDAFIERLGQAASALFGAPPPSPASRSPRPTSLNGPAKPENPFADDSIWED